MRQELGEERRQRRLYPATEPGSCTGVREEDAAATASLRQARG